MPAFRFYIADPFDGTIKGTNNEELAMHYASSEDFYVLDSQEGQWIMADMERVDVEETLEPTEEEKKMLSELNKTYDEWDGR